MSGERPVERMQMMKLVIPGRSSGVFIVQDPAALVPGGCRRKKHDPIGKHAVSIYVA